MWAKTNEKMLVLMMAAVSIFAIASLAMSLPKPIPENPIQLSIAAQSPPIPTAMLLSSTAPIKTNILRVAKFAWDLNNASDQVTNYSLHWGTNSKNYTFSKDFGVTNFGAVSNLLPRVGYYFSVRAASQLGATSEFSGEVFWPTPGTNYVGVGIKTNGVVFAQFVYTNPPGDVVLFEPFIWLTNDYAVVTKLKTGSLVSNTNQPSP